MDVELFRLLLLIIGILFLLGIYFWDRHKRINEEIILNRRKVEKSRQGQPQSQHQTGKQPRPHLQTSPQGNPQVNPGDWDDADSDLAEDLYTPSSYGPSPPVGRAAPLAQGRPATPASTPASSQAATQGFLGLLKRQGEAQTAAVTQRERQEPSLYSRPSPTAQAPRDQHPAQANPRSSLEAEPLDELSELNPEVLEQDRLLLQEVLADDDRREPWLAGGLLQEDEAETPYLEPELEPELEPGLDREPGLEPEPEPEPEQISEQEPEQEQLPELEPAKAPEQAPESGPTMPKGPDAQVGRDLPLRDTEALDLQPEPEEPEPLEPQAAPASASIEPVAEEPILAPLAKDLPQLLVQISLVARGAFLEGTEILDAARALDLKPSRRQVFHRVDPACNEVVYSMASMVEPGTFPLHDMSDFATPGVTFFMQLPCSLEGTKAFQDLLDTAHSMADLLNAELQDENHNLLSRQAMEHNRSQVQEHARQVQLALKRRGQGRRR
jgi:cell division protein ZipA